MLSMSPACLPAQTTGTSPAVNAANAPATLYIMRHAEKPPEGDKNPDLIPQGFQRAKLLPSLFVASPGGAQPLLKRPDVLFATARSKHSDRPVETITPLSVALHEPINHDFEDHETGAIAKEVMSGKYTGKVVLICWHHGEIAHLAEAFGLPPHEKWHDDVFNQIWKIEWVDGKPQLSVIHENLLPGDAQTAQN